jgi:predicted Zn-dependent protease
VVLRTIDQPYLQTEIMKKTVLQGAITVLLFFGAFFAFRQIDWMKLFRIKTVTDKTEKKLGELFWDVFKSTEKEIKNPQVLNAVDSIVTKLCQANKIDRAMIKLHVLEKDEINAFALPNGHLVVYSGLIQDADNPEEIAGVMGHEIAHIELSHVMKKLVNEIGLTVLLTMTTGNGNAEVIRETAKMLSTSAFDRALEKEADIKAVDYLVAAEVNPEPFADFLYKLSAKENEATKYFKWISTHPESKERAAYIIEYSKDKKTDFKPIVAAETWKKVKKEIGE